MMPTPELAPWISTDSPAASLPLVTSASCMVWSAMGSVAASTGPAAALGTGHTRPQSVTAYSA